MRPSGNVTNDRMSGTQRGDAVIEGVVGEFAQTRVLLPQIEHGEPTPARRVGHAQQAVGVEPGRLLDALGRAARHDARVVQVARTVDLGHPQLGAVPGHVRMAPRQPGESRAVGRQGWVEDEVGAGSGGLAVGDRADASSNHHGSELRCCVIEFEANQRRDGLDRGVALVLACAPGHVTGQIEAEPSVPDLALARRGERSRLLVVTDDPHLLAVLHDVEHHAVDDGEVATAVLVQRGSDVLTR